ATGDAAGALADFRRALELPPLSVEALKGHAIALARSQGREPRPLEGDVERAVEVYRDGFSLKFERDVEGAIAAFSRAIQLSPAIGPAFVKRAEMLAVRGKPGDIEQARKDVERARELGLDPKLPDAVKQRL